MPGSGGTSSHVISTEGISQRCGPGQTGGPRRGRKEPSRVRNMVSVWVQVVESDGQMMGHTVAECSSVRLELRRVRTDVKVSASTISDG